MSHFYDKAGWELAVGQTVRTLTGERIEGKVTALKRSVVLKFVEFETEDGEKHEVVHDNVLIIGYPKQ